MPRIGDGGGEGVSGVMGRGKREWGVGAGEGGGGKGFSDGGWAGRGGGWGYIDIRLS